MKGLRHIDTVTERATVELLGFGVMDASVYDRVWDGKDQPATLFVDPVNGSAVGTRERKDLPWNTLAAANAASLSGDTIVLLGDCTAEDLIVRENRKYVGKVKPDGSRPIVQRVIDNNVASPGWTVSNINAVRTGNGVFHIQNSASTGNLRHSELSNTTFWHNYTNAIINVKDVVFYHDGTTEAIGTGVNGGYIGATKGDLIVIGGGTTSQSNGRLTNVVCEFTGSATLWNEATGIMSGCEVSVNYNGAFAVRNKGKAFFSTARNAGAQGWQNVGSGLSEFCKGYGTGNGISGVGSVKGVGFENGESTITNNINCRAIWCEGYAEHDEGMVSWAYSKDWDCYGEAGPNALEGKCHIGCYSVRPRGKTYSTLANAADMSFQNGNILAHTVATGGLNTPCYIVGAVIGISSNTYNQSAFIQGNGHKFVDCSFANFAGKPCLNISEITGTDSGIEFDNCTCYTTGNEAGGAWAIEGTGSTIEIKWRGGSKNTPFGPGIVNTAFDAEERSEATKRSIEVNVNLPGDTATSINPSHVELFDLITHGGGTYASGAPVKVVVESLFTGTTLNTSETFVIQKGAVQDAHYTATKIVRQRWHAAWPTIDEPAHTISAKLKNETSLKFFLKAAGAGESTTPLLLRVTVYDLPANIALLGNVISPTDTVFTDATSPEIVEVAEYEDKFLKITDAANTYAEKTSDVYTPNFFNDSGFSPISSPTAGSFYNKIDKQIRVVYNTTFTADVSGADVSFYLTIPVNRSSSYPFPAGSFLVKPQLAGSRQQITIDGNSYPVDICFQDSVNADRVFFRVTNSSLSLSAVTIQVAAQIDYISA